MKQAEQERKRNEREAEQLAQAQKEMEIKAAAEKKRKDEENRLKVEQKRLEKERLELETQKAEYDARLKSEQEQLEKERRDVEAQKLEQERLEQEKKEQEAQKAEQERLEQEKLKKEQEEKKRLEEYARTHGSINGHEYIDLGLPSGLKWATCNVGATSPEDYGDYYAWGDIKIKSSYTENNSVAYGKNIDDIGGDSQYDAARVNWEGSWRLPTKEELQELKDECTWKWIRQNGVDGYNVTGPNGNSIFLPAAGGRRDSSLYGAEEYGYYWSSSPDESNRNYAYYLYLNSKYYRLNWNTRSCGRSVRPVTF